MLLLMYEAMLFVSLLCKDNHQSMISQRLLLRVLRLILFWLTRDRDANRLIGLIRANGAMVGDCSTQEQA